MLPCLHKALADAGRLPRLPLQFAKYWGRPQLTRTKTHLGEGTHEEGRQGSACAPSDGLQVLYCLCPATLGGRWCLTLFASKTLSSPHQVTPPPHHPLLLPIPPKPAGTAVYMSPELIENRKTHEAYDPVEVDVWAAGIWWVHQPGGESRGLALRALVLAGAFAPP
ncbi:hypothetical protein ABPG75_000221 [Micractinium tetrahymenae]